MVGLLIQKTPPPRNLWWRCEVGKSWKKMFFNMTMGTSWSPPEKKSHDSRGIFKHPQDSKTIELKERIIMFNYNNHKVVANFLKGFSYKIMG